MREEAASILDKGWYEKISLLLKEQEKLHGVIELLFFEGKDPKSNILPVKPL